MNNVRQLSLSCTAKKISYRQSKDGIVISFLIHHAEMPDNLAIADLGTTYMLALVEIDDNDQPKAAQERAPAPVSSNEPVRAAAVQRAGMLCHEKPFQEFLQDEFLGLWKLTKYELPDDERAADVVRTRCGVATRRYIKTDDDAFARWQELYAAYQAWLRE